MTKLKDVDPNSPTGRRVIADLKGKLDTNDRNEAISFGKKYGIFKDIPVKPAFKKDGGLMEAIEKVKKENPVKMEKGGGSAEEKLKQLLDELKSIPQDKYTPKRDQDRIDSIMGQISKISGMRKGGEAIPAKFKGFSKLPEAVQEKMDPGLAKKFERGGPVKMGSGGGVCRGMGAARAGGKFKLR